eukprot:TRINITY_DN1947_c1_g1_i1.p1 TRINITY_DN1947_c1_g1~~TRINITY_DN1947_c1_g1_i1.p1  ORF type:complete len:380 (+),score=75.74 TRINITY_DN1947_c1_g1_i1:545-1684(+)
MDYSQLMCFCMCRNLKRKEKKRKLAKVTPSHPPFFFFVFFSSFCDLLQCHQVCKWWNSVLSSHAVWKSLFLRTFGRPKEEPRDWFAEFIRIKRCMTFSFPPKPSKEEDEDEDEDEEWHFCPMTEVDDYDEGNNNAHWKEPDVQDEEISFLEVSTKMHDSIEEHIKEEVAMHKLGLILFVLSENCNKLDVMKDCVRVGYQRKRRPIPKSVSGDYDSDDDNKSTDEEDNSDDCKVYAFEEDTEVIPLSKFGYAILTDQAETIFPRMRESDPGIHRDFPFEDTIYGRHFEESFKLDKKNPSAWSVGVAPNVEGEFQPFVHYLVMQPDRNVRSHRHVWETTTHGWLPVYMNASFYWFLWVSLVTTFENNQFSISPSYSRGVCW